MAQMLAKTGRSGLEPVVIGNPGSITSVSKIGSGAKSKVHGKALINKQLQSFLCDTLIEHNTTLDVDSKPGNNRLCHIVCTIGPASREVDMLTKLIKAGMNICRLNFSHGTYEYHEGTVKNIRDAVARLPPGTVVATALDTKGPEIRTGLLEGGASAEVTLETGKTITLTTNDSYMEKCSAEIVWVDYKNIVSTLNVGSIIYVDDGLISLKVKQKEGDRLICNIENGGKLGSKKGCNLPGTPVDLPAVSEKDKKDLLFGLEQKVDMVFASFIQDANGIKQIRSVLGEKGKYIKIICKIESFAGIYNFPEIIRECDGAMVARGDMGIEIPPEKVFIAQKFMISECNRAGKPVICATQMLESMTYKPRATRAESNDVANAVLDGADCVMLSGESAKGLYPVEAVSHMAAVCLEAESVFSSLRVFNELKRFTPFYADCAQAMALAAVDASYQTLAAAIIVPSTTGRTARLLSTYRPRCPIIMVTRDEIVARQLLLHRCLVPHLLGHSGGKSFEEEINECVMAGIDRGLQEGILRNKDTIVLVIGTSSGTGNTNCIKIIQCKKGPQREE